jgi:O-antigen/teichoic acid export membrane protein
MIVLRVSINKYLAIHEKWGPKDFRNIQKIWRYALGLFGISIVALITKQFDKFLISGFLTLTELGAYNLATTLGNLAVIFASALSITALTDFTRMYSNNESKELNTFYHSFSNVVSFVIIAMGSYIAVFSFEIIKFWTHNIEYAEIMKNVAPLVVISITLIGLQEIPYALALAHGNTKTNLLTGIFSLPFIVGLTYLFISKWGLVGAGWAYFVTMLGQTTVYLLLIYRKYLKSEVLTLMLKNFIAPFVICFGLANGSRKILYNITNNNTAIVIGAVIAGTISLGLLFTIFDRESIKRIIHKRRA